MEGYRPRTRCGSARVPKGIFWNFTFVHFWCFFGVICIYLVGWGEKILSSEYYLLGSTALHPGIKASKNILPTKATHSQNHDNTFKCNQIHVYDITLTNEVQSMSKYRCRVSGNNYLFSSFVHLYRTANHFVDHTAACQQKFAQL